MIEMSMDSMSRVTELDEVQVLAYWIWQQVDIFCRDQGITYYMAYGSLIGAMRHQGFIPWDDDIDIWMKREDYALFELEFPGWARRRGLYLISPNLTKGYDRIFSKVCLEHTVTESSNSNYRQGIFIDLFIIDGSPNNTLFRFIRIKHLQIIRNLLTLIGYCPNNRTSTTVLQHIYSVLGSILRKILDVGSLSRRYSAVATKNLCNSSNILLIPVRKSKGRALEFDSELFKDVVDVVFENSTAMVPNGYDEVLTQIYGDWRIPPSLDLRIPMHSENSYIDRQYIRVEEIRKELDWRSPSRKVQE